jgi:hypothetical protein
VSKGRDKQTFYTIPEYEAWKDNLGGGPRGWNIKYYKGQSADPAGPLAQCALAPRPALTVRAALPGRALPRSGYLHAR